MPYIPFGNFGQSFNPPQMTSFRNIRGGTITSKEIIIAGGTQGVVRSQNYSESAETGWGIFGDGSASFYGDLTIGANAIILGDVYSDNWDGSIPASLSSVDAGASVGYYLDSSEGAAQFEGNMWLGGSLIVSGDAESENFVAPVGNPLTLDYEAGEGWQLDGTTGAAVLAGGVQAGDNITFTGWSGTKLQWIGGLSDGASMYGSEVSGDSTLHVKSDSVILEDDADSEFGRFTSYSSVDTGTGLRVQGASELTLSANTGTIKLADLTEVSNGTGKKFRVVNGDGSHTWLGYSDGRNYITHEDGQRTIFRNGSNVEKVRVDDSGLYVPGGRLDMAGGYIDMGGGQIYYSGSSGHYINFTSSYIGVWNGNWALLCYNGNTQVRQQLQATEFVFYGDDNTGIYQISGDRLGIKAANREIMRFWWSGSVEVAESNAINDLTAGNAANVVVGSSGDQLRRSTSSIRYKPGWEFADEDFLADLEMPTPIVWTEDPEDALGDEHRTKEDTRQTFLGFGTEHVVEKLGPAAAQDDRGQGPELYDTRSLVAILSAKVKRLEKQVAALQK